jgi:hypothetical protein
MEQVSPARTPQTSDKYHAYGMNSRQAQQADEYEPLK